jgi:serine/threonine-protein kinase
MTPQLPAQQALIANRYRRAEHLGNGSFGEVWRGRDLQQDVEVAIKLIGPHVTLDEVLLETQLLTRLRDHERVVTIWNVSIAPPIPFIVMDYLPNGSVEARLDAGQVSLVEAVRWTRNALAGLAHAHAMGVLHRDIKPGNLLLDNEERAVLSDFGIAEDTIRGLLANPALYGIHAAPELLHNQPSSVQTDIFALGCTLYRLLTGEYPFASIDEIRAGAEPVDVHKLNPQIPLSLRNVVRTALAPDPADRFPDARRMNEAIGSCEIRNSWVRVNDADAIEAWSTDTGDGLYDLRVTARQRAGDFELRVRLDRGAGPRQVLATRHSSRARALQARRTALVQVVEGKRPA